jgi:hypothetical protein
MKSKTYYAESHGFGITEDVYEGGFLRYPKNSEPFTDLWRFNSKVERDDFVDDSNSHNAITAADARREHKERFAYLKALNTNVLHLHN